MFIPLLIQVHNSVYSCIHIDSVAQHHLHSYWNWFWCITLCTAVFISILKHDTLYAPIHITAGIQHSMFLLLLIPKHSSVYICIHIGSSAQCCFYWFWYTSLCALVLILVHKSVHLNAYWFWNATPCKLLFILIIVHSSLYICIHNDSGLQSCVH